jgi:hypothetical protein
MSKRQRLGDDPTAPRKVQIKEAVGLKDSAGKPAAWSSQKAAIRQKVERGGAKNYYVSKKEGGLIQKVTVHLPFDMVTALKKEAVDRRITLSELIRERIRQT